MEKKMLALFFSLAMVFPAFASSPPTIPSGSIITDVETIGKFFPRTEGSPEEDALVAFLKERLEAQGIFHREENFLESLGFHSFSRILEAEVRGERRDSLNIVVPLNTSPSSTRETNGVGIAIALGLLENLARGNPALGVRVLFMGGEFDHHPEAPLGTKQFLTLYAPEDPVCFLYLNITAPPKRLLVGVGGGGLVTPRWFIERTAEGLVQNQIPSLLRGNEIEFHRLGIGREKTLIEPYLAAGYPALLLEGEGSLDRSEWEGWMENILAFFTGFIDGSTGGIPENEETLYLLFQLGSRFFIVPEAAYLSIFLSLPALLLLYPFFARRRFRRYVHAMQRRLWAIPLMVLLLFTLLLLGTLLMNALVALRDSPEIWQTNPALFYLLKISGTLLGFVLLLGLFKNLHVLRRDQFYSAAALLLLLIDLLVVSFINMAFSYYILWALLWTFLLTILRRKSLKTICLIFSLVGPLIFFINVFSLSKGELLQVLLFSKFKGNILQSLLILPFVFLITRISFLLFPPRKAGKKVFRNLTLAVLGGGCGILLLYLSLFDPYRGSLPHPVEVEEVILPREGSRRITIDSPLPLPLDSLLLHGESFVITEGSRRTRVSSDRLPPAPTISLGEHPFLQRREIVIGIFPGNLSLSPVKVAVRLSAPGELILLDANYPYTMEGPSGGGATIHLGANPPLPLMLSLMIPDDLFLQGRIAIDYLVPPVEYRNNGKNYLIRGRRTYLEEFSFPPILSVPTDDT